MRLLKSLKGNEEIVIGLFDKFKREGNNDFESACSKMGAELVALYLQEKGIAFETMSELERQVLAVYFFGMADGLRQDISANEDADKIAKTVINVLMKEFKYSENQARQFFNSIVDDLQSKDPTNTQYAIIHKGLYGYFKWKDGNKNDVIANVCQIIDILNK